MCAAESGQAEAVEALVKCGAHVNGLMNNDTTPLYLAAERGLIEVAEVLIANGADINYSMDQHVMSASKDIVRLHPEDSMKILEGETNPYGYGHNSESGNGATALHAAAEGGHIEMVKFLLEQGAKQLTSMNGVSPLHTAAQYNQPEIAKVLIAYGGRIDAHHPSTHNHALHDAAGAGALDVAKILLQNGADPNVQNIHGATPLHIAVRHAHADLAAFLIKQGADPNKRCNQKIRPIHIAAAMSNFAMIRVLLKGKANALSLGADHMTPLHYVAEHPQHVVVSNVIAKLLDHVSDKFGENRKVEFVNARVKSSGATALTMTSKVGNLQAVQVLIDNGADLEARATQYKATALYMAAQNGHARVMQALLAAGANPNVELSSIRVTPLHIACERGQIQAVAILLESRDIQQFISRGNGDGMTALHLASGGGYVEIVRMLLEAGADPNGLNRIGSTPLAVAVEAAQPGVAEALLSNKRTICDVKDGYGRGMSQLIAATAPPVQQQLIAIFNKYADRCGKQRREL